MEMDELQELTFQAFKRGCRCCWAITSPLGTDSVPILHQASPLYPSSASEPPQCFTFFFEGTHKTLITAPKTGITILRKDHFQLPVSKIESQFTYSPISSSSKTVNFTLPLVKPSKDSSFLLESFHFLRFELVIS